MPVDEDNTEKFFNEASNLVSSNLKKATLMVERDARLMCPVETGTLRRSITHAFVDKLTAIVGTNVEYGEYVELGLKSNANYPAQPYLRPALHKNAKAIKDLLRK